VHRPGERGRGPRRWEPGPLQRVVALGIVRVGSRVGASLQTHTAFSCGGTPTVYQGESWDDNPEHAALHDQVRVLQREVNALKDLMDAKAGWWLRRRLTNYLRTR